MGRNHRAIQDDAAPKARGTECALPTRVVQALRYPEPTEADFTPTRFTPASTKCWFAVHYLRFVSSDFPRHQFTQRFYSQLMHTCGHIAHYSLMGFWTEFFTSTANKVEFLDQTIRHHCYGQPDHTWSDVERLVIQRLRAADLLALYQSRLRAECHAGERAELARLLAKYGDDKPDPGILRTVLVPCGSPATGRRSKAVSQLVLSLG